MKTEREIYLTKIGNIKLIWSKELPSSPSSVTAIKDCADRYFLSFVVEVEPVQLDAENQSIGIDLGIKTLTEHDRSESAAKNINPVGIGHCHDSKRTQRQSKTISVASVDEASRITVASAR